MTNSGSTRTIVQLFTKGCRMRGVERRTPPATVPGQPPAQGLYDPRDEHDACGVGFVVNIKGKKSHTIVRQALGVLINLLHRGACGCEPNTGDGAGILLQTPDKFLRRECDRLGIPLPQPKEYGCGLVFLPRDPEPRDKVRALLHSIVEEEGQRLCGWRDVPTDDRLLGATARSVEPCITQVFIGRGAGVRDHAGFERKLYVIRKLFEKAVAALDIPENKFAYIPSLSSNTLIYKGMLSADQIVTMYPDLADPDVESALALVHQRFSTNTFPSWPLAHPYRYIAHNGEINTLRGNINWMRAREGLLRSAVLGDDLRKILPVIREGGSDTATFDNVLEFLVMNGRSLPHAVLMMIPEPWSGNDEMSPERRAFYEYHSSLMEPWDGPACIAFTDGTVIGAVLRRQEAFGYTQEDLRLLIAPMAAQGEEALGSMGTDTSLAVLSERPRLLYDYFKQLFAQVTNPPLDAIREELVTSMVSTIGPERNLLKPEPASCRQIGVRYPILDNDDLAKLRYIAQPGFRSITLSML